jgi:hypothetical protein
MQEEGWDLSFLRVRARQTKQLGYVVLVQR